MNNITTIKQRFIQEFGEAYIHYGLPKLMGRIVGLLLFSGKAISLDEITTELNVSKGPVSQIMNRLRDHNLIERVWIPGDRKDYYKPHDEIFGNAFRNQMLLQKKTSISPTATKKSSRTSIPKKCIIFAKTSTK